MTDSSCKSRHRASRAFSLLEVVIATFIVGALLVAAMRTAGSALSSRRSLPDHSRAHLLAHALAAEIMERCYEEPVDTPVFGPEATEDAGGNRTEYDDVDDYHGWVADPPQERDGTPLPDLAGWQRSVTVDYVDPDALETVVGSDQGAKRVIVTVSRDGTPLVTLQTPVTKAWQPPPYD